jgi:AraC-like DNA-binding protein
LEGIDELRFIFTSPTFISEKTPKARREFYIPRLSRERSLFGSEFEIRLRNELSQKAIAKECADWIRRKAAFKSNVTNEQMMGFMTVDRHTYMPISGFTTVDLGCERGNNAYYLVQKTDSTENSSLYIKLFDELWNDPDRLQEVTDIVIESITTAYRENAPDFIYFLALYNIFNEFLDDISEDEMPNELTGFKSSKIWSMLYDFQRDAALAIINKLEKFNGCILADSVGLGKTFTALAVIKYYENRNKSVLVLCPKKLSENWNTYKGNYVNNPIAEDRLRYDVLYHTDLSRDRGNSNGIDLQRLNWGNYDLVVIDESHNFRNGGEVSGEEAKENRYLKLMNKVIRSGVKTKVLMLSATPVNNRFIDLKNQLALAYEGDAAQINERLATSKPIDEIFRNAQKSFKHYEYSSVIQVALYSMAAVQGGLNARTAQALREYFCRELSKSSSSTEYISIGYEAIITYAELVRELKSSLTGNKYVDRAKAIIRNAIDKPLTVGTLAQEMGISPDYLSRMFKRLTGSSLKRYITDQKMKLAGNLLRHTDYSVADICLLCGVGSQNYFCKLFKSKFGVTPFEYKKP